MSEWPSETKRMCELRMEPPLVMSAFAMTGLSMYISNSDAWKMPGKKYQITLDRQFNYMTLPMMMGLVPMEDGVYIVSASSVRRIRDTKGQLRWIPTQNGRNTAESGYDVSPTRGSMSFDIWLEPKVPILGSAYIGMAHLSYRIVQPRMPQRDHPERAVRNISMDLAEAIPGKSGMVQSFPGMIPSRTSRGLKCNTKKHACFS
ncbi:hypothetical protein CISG_00654 [Coccidioides immitis RMSCC 3703]|uniref:Uncharacterized protein n=1 Tax=Coccidioides immitis RMSCC 3703 TaxID=454286 RepID=A0A0J8QQ95_COCIT|nr:hypothetical protein CISG_00654 [Coccidioides immitis RMSCC 3703]